MKNKIFTDSFLYLLLSSGVIISNLFLTNYISENQLIFIFIIFVIFFGLPHGALDTLLAKKNKLYNNFSGFVFFNLIYILVALIIFFLWFKASNLILFLFLLISIFHFSEDWKGLISIYQRLVIASSVISLTVFFKKEEVQSIFFSLTQSYQSNYIIDFFYFFCFFLLPLLLIIIFLNFRNKEILFSIITIFITAIMLNPLLYFLCYFCFFHSIKNFKESKKLLFPNNKMLQRKVIFLNLFITITLYLIIYNIFLIGDVEDKLLKIVFIGLASLTVPHMILKAYVNTNSTRL